MAKNKYPYIFVHGMLGWGEGEGMYKAAPYWGMLCGSLIKRLRAEGFDAYAPKVSPLGSAWDRACELYAIIRGGRVDYGEVHSKKNNHARFGRTYDGLVTDWSSENKVHLLVHSFGGATMRELVQLMADGCEEEVAATVDGSISPLFEGGKGDWIQSITSMASPHDGTTFMYAFPKFIKALTAAFPYIANFIGNTDINKIYDFHLEQYDLTTIPTAEKPMFGKSFNLAACNQFAKSHDQLFYDLSLHGAKSLNEHIKCHDTTYYFSFPTQGTEEAPDGTQKKAPIMNVVLAPFGNGIGKYDKNTVNDIPVDKTWLPNDGLVPTVSALYPKSEPHIDFKDANGVYKKGIWHVMDVQVSDHGTIIGGSLNYIGPGRNKPFYDFYHEHLALLESLE